MKRLLYILLTFTAVSCLERDFSGEAAVLDFPDVVEVPADLASGEMVCDTVDILSTGVWSASVASDPCPDWITLVNDSGVNLSDSPLFLPLVFSLADNENPMSSREVEIRVTTEESQKVLKVVQKPLEPRFSVPEPHGFNDISATFTLDREEFRISVVTNWYWIAEILPETTARVSIDRSEGYGSGHVILTMENNTMEDGEEESRPKVAYLRISSTSTGFDPVIIEFNQKALK